MLSMTAGYALRAVLVLAAETTSGSMRADEIADRTGSPRNYMAKTLNALARMGVLRSTRGPQGGFQLAIPPATLTVADIVDSFHEPRRAPRCLMGDAPCNPEAPCVAHARWTAIETARRAPLATTTIAEMIGLMDATEPFVSPRHNTNVVPNR